MPRGHRDDLHRAPHPGEHVSRPRATTQRRVSPQRIGGGMLLLLMLTLAACANDNGGQATLDKNQVFTWPYVFAVDSIGGPGSKTHGETFDPAIIQNAADSVPSPCSIRVW